MLQCCGPFISDDLTLTIFYDVPTEIATQIIGVAVDERGIDSVETRLSSGSIPHKIIGDTIQLSAMGSDARKAIGTIAKKKKVEWYKRIDLGELVGNIIFRNWNCIDPQSKLGKIVDELSKWAIKK